MKTTARLFNLISRGSPSRNYSSATVSNTGEGILVFNDIPLRNRNTEQEFFFFICNGIRHRISILLSRYQHQPRPRGSSPLKRRNVLVAPGTPEGLPYSFFRSGHVGGVSLGNHFTPQSLSLLYTCEMII